MLKPVNIAIAGATVIVALGTGYYMQSSAQPRQVQVAMARAVPDVQPMQAARSTPVPDGEAMAIPGVPAEPGEEVTMMPAAELSALAEEAGFNLNTEPDAPEDPEVPAPQMAALSADTDFASDVDSRDPLAGCEAVFAALPSAAAMADVMIEAPCQPNARVTIHHNGMMFTTSTDAEGLLSATVPALAEEAMFMAAFANGQTLVARTEISSLMFYDRAVVQWKGDAGLQIHALEYGADYGDEGHVWMQAPGEIAAAATGRSGFITRLGDADSPEALLAEVYTFPTGTATDMGDIALSVEAEISERNCNSSVEAQTIQFWPDRALKVQDVVLEMPECDSFGGFLVLKNLLEDLTIAAN